MNYNPGIANYYKKSFRLTNSSKKWYEISLPGAASFVKYENFFLRKGLSP